MNYTLHQLRIFLKVSENQSVTQSSEELFLTQPAVSIQLKKLQDQFDIPLTEVIGRQLYITDFGKEVAKVAKRILSEAGELEHLANRYKGILSGNLKFSSVSTGKYVLPYFLSDFMNEHLGIQLSMDVTNKEQVVKALKANTIDFALVSVLPEDIELEQIELMKNQLFLVGSAGSTLSSKAMVNKRDLARVPFILREEGSATRGAAEAYLESKNIKPSSRLILTSNEAVKQAVIAGLGYSVLPFIGMKDELKDNALSIIPMAGLPIETSWNIVYLKAKKLSPVAKAFVEHVKSNKEEVINRNFSDLAIS